MDHSIQLPLDDCQRFYKAYLKSGVQTSQPLAFDSKKSASENLRRLSVDALHPTNTFAALYAYEPVFLDLICRWIEDPSIEADYCKSIGESKPVIEGVIVVNALTRLVGVHQESLNLIESFISKANFFDRLQENAKESSIAELEYILIAFIRLIDHDAPRFKHFIDPKILHRIINIDNAGARVAKFLATMILCRYINASEHAQKVMLDKIDNPIGSLEGDDSINFKYFHFLEAKRLNRFMNLPEKVPSSKACIEIQESDFCSLVHLVCGRLIPKHSISDMKTTTDTSFVPTREALNVIRNVTSHILMNKPVILYGAAGSGKTYLVNQLAKRMGYHDSIVKVHLGDQTDAKILLGTYTSGSKPGSFEWRAGVLTTAVREGKWLLIEDIDRAPTEVLSVLLPLLENRKLSIPSRGEVIRAANGFQIIATIRTSDSKNIPDMIGIRNWTLVPVETPSDKNLKDIIRAKYPLLTDLIPYFIRAFNEVVQLYSSNAFISLNKGSNPRIVSIRDLMKLCARCNKILQNETTSPNQILEASTYDNVFAEVVDCFGSALNEQKALAPIVNTIGEVFEVPTSRVNLFLSKHVPAYNNGDDHLTIGRATLKKDTMGKSTKSVNAASFARTNHSLRLMEQIGAALSMTEPVLLVGETGTGKTTVVQQMAKLMNKKITVINVSQQTESSDLLGGYKPVTSKIMALPLQETFDELFSSTFSKKKNERFSSVLNKCFNKGQWKNVVKLWLESVKMARDVLRKQEPERGDDETPKKKRKLEIKDKSHLLERWSAFEEKARNFETHSSSLEDAFVFDFVEGSLVKAVRNGEWLLLDEINLASPDTLESIADLITDKLEERSLLLTEKGDINSINAHPEFRIFACMNPSTDIGKRDLPLSIRSRFSEIYVHSPDSDIQDLLAIIDKYVGRFSVTDEWLGNDIAELYLSAKKLADSNQIVDGANQRPHFSIRTLTRTLLYVSDIVNIYGVRRSLYEGFCMSFLTLLDSKSEAILHPLIKQYTIDKLKNTNSVMRQTPPDPSNGSEKYVQFKHYWLPQGSFDIIPQPHYIITPFVEKNILNLVRATSGKRFPVLIQGPTSAGKTSMIQYLANISGHKFVRINNHEHTDLQEYLGTYVAVDGKLVFKEGILVEALKNGHWIVLDELNLAPTDVLEALNRLLDDNRELFIPETQEVVHPHPDFMLFATQNPPGIYGGRKILSRAFKNRFLELHFDDIPQDELETILTQRCQIAPSYSKKIVEVYRQLSVQRQSTRLFEQKNSFATLRDLFRWALRGAVGYEELAAHGYMILAERVRVPEERDTVSRILEKVMKVKLNMDSYYESLENKLLVESESSLVWTKGMRKLAVLVATSMKYNEPLLLVGETGCGKTTVCQILAHFEGKSLVTVNAHQNTETSDLLGAQRPVRNKKGTNAALTSILQDVLSQAGMVPDDDSISTLLAAYDTLPKEKVDEEKRSEIKRLRHELTNLFEWCDGPLVTAMKSGDFFLLDEISLADDSVLERLNSVLEPERSLLLAEKGTEVDPIYASSGFQFLATMNPGGDYGKKELSPALRNRFTEIWVPSMEDMNDTFQIVQSRLDIPFKQLCSPIIEFAKWYAMTFGGGRISSGVISLRDILAWVEFINHAQLDPASALYHGSLMVFVDSLGTNNTSFLATNEQNLMLQKQSCIDKLSSLAGCKFQTEGNLELEITESHIKIGHFGIPKSQSPSLTEPFALHAPTTALNAMRVLRGMQVKKPILLEGSPGVGKTSLISALAQASGNPLIRINLSEQTDLVDLFGSDVPTEGGKAGEFVWRDAPFLRAMKHGEWVLLDEMNLASQSVLEGLNACLDHRGTAYIPELGRSFPRHEKFTVFAAQNPQAQGGGRKGLPKSFVNRFTVVYVDTLKAEDLTLIAQHLYPTIDPKISKGIIDVISRIEKEVVIDKKWGQSGGPWEFNLRDTLRWLDMYSSRNLADDITPSDFLNMIVCQRFRTSKDQNMARACFEEVFGPPTRRDKYYNLTETFLQAGGCALARSEPVQYRSDEHLLPLQCNFEVMESALRSVVHNLPLILTGPSSSGKTSIVKFLGSILGRKVDIFAMNSDVDSTDILGGFEQVDLTKAVNNYIGEVISFLHVSLLASDLANSNNALTTSLLKDLEQSKYGTTNFDQLLSALESLELGHLAARGREISNKINSSKGIRFEWFDGLLVKAVQNGHWLILDNANLCSPSVLDRLNSLLERNGKLIINECSNEFGEPRVITPHPDFRLFLTTDPKYGELSRAMRNRGVEVFLDPLSARLTTFDSSLLGVEEQKSEIITEKFKMEERIEKLKLEELKKEGVSRIPLSAVIHSELSTTRPLGVLHDLVMESSMTSVILGAISPQTADDLNTLRDTIRSSKLFEADFELTVDSIIQEYTLLQGTATHQQSVGCLNDFSEHLKSKGFSLPEFEHLQPLNPLLNTFVNITFDKENLHVYGSESIYLFQALELLLHARNFVSNLSKTSMEKNAKDLTYLERSAAFELGRTLKKHPKVQIFKIMNELLSFIFAAFQGPSTMFKVPGAFEAISNFLILWNSLAESASGQHASKLPIYKELIEEWYDSVKSQWSPSNVDSLLQTLKSFEQDINMTTGLSMEVIWHGSRGNYPGSAGAWEKAMRIVEISNNFDSVTRSLPFSSQMQELSRSLQEVFRDVSTNEVPDGEFNDLCTLLLDGITRLSSVGDHALLAQDFGTEYRLLFNFLMAGNYSKLSSHERIATKAKVPTIRLIASSRDGKMPYPPVFDTLWNIDTSESFVSGMFTDKFLHALFSKVDSFESCSGELLDGTYSEMIEMRQLSIENSESILRDKIQVFSALLVQWYTHILDLHKDVLSERSTALLSSMTVEATENFSLENLELPVKEMFFIEVVMGYFGPAVRTALNAKDLSSLGKAWVLFSCGCIQLYVPDTPFDPAQKEHIEYNFLSHQKAVAEEVRSSWKTLRTTSYGDEPIIGEELIPNVNSELVKPQVIRFESSSDQLFEEWDSFMKSNIDAETVKGLLSSAESFSGKFLDMARLFQNNSARFLVRLRDSFTVFSDLNDLLRGYVSGLKLGFDLLSIETENKSSPVPSLSWTTNVNDLISSDRLSTSFECLRPFLKKQKPDSSLPEKTMKFFIKLCYTQSNCGKFDHVETVLQNAFQFLYYRWTLRRLKAEEEEIQNNSLFKYSDESADIGDDFRNLFPDHEDVVDADQEISKRNDSFDEIYYQISKDYMDAFSASRDFNLEEIVEEGSSLSSYISKNAAVASGTTEVGNFTALISQLSTSISAAQKRDEKLDFYHGYSTFEFKRALAIVNVTKKETLKLLAEWPEHSTLQCIARCCSEFANFPIKYSVSKLLQKVEQIYTYLIEWEKYAHSGVSLATSVNSIVELIISWRKLELQTWSSLFDHENYTLETSMGKWWFYLFEVLLLPTFGDEEIDHDSCSKIVSALNTFLGQTSYGEFGIRLKLIRSFETHILTIDQSSPIAAALANVLSFYEQFVPVVDKAIKEKKKSLEKDISEVILLARWKDVNPDALKQSARRSHNSLYKIVRKYRAVLASQISTLVESGLPVDQTLTVRGENLSHSKISDVFYDSVLTKISTWNDRPTRFRKLDRVVENMGKYIQMLESQTYPNLTEYTTSLLGEMEKLRNETPKKLTKENKKTIAALKAQKSKLMSDTIKDIKSMGIKIALQTKVIAAQSSSSLVLATATTFKNTKFEGSDAYFFRILDLLPRLRVSISECNEEVPQPFVEKCMAAIENLVFTTTATRVPLGRFSKAFELFMDYKASFENLSDAYGGDVGIVKATHRSSLMMNLENMKFNLYWVDKFISFVNSLQLESTPEMDKLMQRLGKIQLEASDLKRCIPHESSILTEASTKWNDAYMSFHEGAIEELVTLEIDTPCLSFVAKTLHKLMADSTHTSFIQSSTSIESISSLEEIEKVLRSLSNAILIAVQNVKENNDSFDSEKEEWFQESQTKLFESIKRLNAASISKYMKRSLDLISRHEYNASTSAIVQALVKFTLPLVDQYGSLLESFLSKSKSNYFENSKSTYILATCLHNIAVNGFCSPQADQEQKQDDNLQDGTGLGDGSGAADSTKDIDEEDLAEAAQEENKEKDNKEDDMDEEKDNAHDIEGDMAGDLEEAENDENDEQDQDEDEELNEEIDNLDDSDPNAVDEKMWDEQVEDDKMKEKESDEVPQNQDDNLEGNDEDSKDKNEKSKDEAQADEMEDEPDAENQGEENSDEGEEEENEEEQLGEQEDEVKNDDDGEALDEHVPESEVLDLPEDMNLDSEGEEEEAEEAQKDDDMDMEDEQMPDNIDSASEAENEEGMEEEGKEEDDQQEGETEETGEPEENAENEEENEEDAASEDSNSDVEELKNENAEEDQKADNASKLEAEGNDGADQDNDTEEITSDVKQESGNRGQGDDNEDTQENEDVGAAGGASLQMDQKDDSSNSNDDSKDEISESLKQLGDSLKEFHRRRQEIREASERDEESKESANENLDEFEHVDGDNADTDTQAMGSADKDQVQKIDEDKAMDQEDEHEEAEVKEEVTTKDEGAEVENPEVKEDVEMEEESKNEDSIDGRIHSTFKNEQVFDADQNQVKVEDMDEDEEDVEEEVNMEVQKPTSEQSAVVEYETASKLWSSSEQATQELASGLCEQLRLILEPTMSTKLKGDYKTGKRLNMKRIIPYIASDFRKDKIWLRRTKPSKRQYQIMIAVDDSKSMTESNSHELAFHSIALVSKALTQLESGEISIVRFGEDVKVVHPFDKPFNFKDSGPQVFQWFDFQQTKTDVKKLCSTSLDLFEKARASTSTDIWQLQIIISDGVCEDHESLLRLVREARDKKVMLVFVILDGINQKESILDMSQVNYVPDSHGGTSLKVTKYLDSFPFEFYVVVKNINELPQMLSLILRQYFSEISSI